MVIEDKALARQLQQIAEADAARVNYRIHAPRLVSLGHRDRCATVISDYFQFGFALIELDNSATLRQQISMLAATLGLGRTIVPRQYEAGEAESYSEDGINEITVRQATETERQVAFYGNQEQGLHSDGTLEPIGAIPSSILACVRPSPIGGESVVFNSAAAFVELVRVDIASAVTLMHPHALRRVDISRTGAAQVGPAFAIRRGEVLSRFSLDRTCDWAYGFERVRGLREAFEFVVCCTADPAFTFSVKLAERQALLLANDRTAHGRRAFEVVRGEERQMLRALYGRRPALRV